MLRDKSWEPCFIHWCGWLPLEPFSNRIWKSLSSFRSAYHLRELCSCHNSSHYAPQQTSACITNTNQLLRYKSLESTWYTLVSITVEASFRSIPKHTGSLLFFRSAYPLLILCSCDKVPFFMPLSKHLHKSINRSWFNQTKTLVLNTCFILDMIAYQIII